MVINKLRGFAHKVYTLSVPGYLLRTIVAFFRLPKFIDATVESFKRLTGFLDGLHAKVLDMERRLSALSPLEKGLEEALVALDAARSQLGIFDAKLQAQCEATIETQNIIQQIASQLLELKRDSQAPGENRHKERDDLVERMRLLHHGLEAKIEECHFKCREVGETVQLIKEEIFLVKQDVVRGRESLLKAVSRRQNFEVLPATYPRREHVDEPPGELGGVVRERSATTNGLASAHG